MKVKRDRYVSQSTQYVQTFGKHDGRSLAAPLHFGRL